MADNAITKVDFTPTNINKCLCPWCPVQVKSKCIAGLKKDLSGVLKKTPLKPEEVPGVYCGTGKASCSDIDTRQNCMCGGCAVFTGYNLANGKPVGYYCREGTPS